MLNRPYTFTDAALAIYIESHLVKYLSLISTSHMLAIVFHTAKQAKQGTCHIYTVHVCVYNCTCLYLFYLYSGSLFESPYFLLVLVHLFLVLLHLLSLGQHLLLKAVVLNTNGRHLPIFLTEAFRELFNLGVQEGFCGGQSLFVFLQVLCCVVELSDHGLKLVLVAFFNFRYLAVCFLSILALLLKVLLKCLGLWNRILQ